MKDDIKTLEDDFTPWKKAKIGTSGDNLTDKTSKLMAIDIGLQQKYRTRYIFISFKR